MWWSERLSSLLVRYEVHQLYFEFDLNEDLTFEFSLQNFANRLLSGSIDELLTFERQLSCVAFDKTPKRAPTFQDPFEIRVELNSSLRYYSCVIRLQGTASLWPIAIKPQLK
jgi:hypothetical protein